MSTRWAIGRGFFTRQIAFSALSMVSIKAIALISSTARPTRPSRLARVENWVIALSTGLAMVSGNRLATK